MLVNKIKINNTNLTNGYVNIPLTSKFSIETQQYDFIENKFNLSNSDIINPIIDYEKVKLYPSLNNVNVDSLTFRLHFNNGVNWDVNSTCFSNIGFIGDDVLNKRKRLEKTFIRLSFYDSKDLKTQNLLYYSTIFVDTDKLYSTYIKDGLVMDNIKTDFFIPNSKLSSKLKSFEGFNLYLFKDDLIKNNTKTIYMRVDFNSALNGRSSLFMKNKPSNLNGYKMQELYDNLFYEVTCEYNTTLNKYTYEFTGLNTTQHNDIEDRYIKNTLNIDLYQAKVI